MFNASWDAHAVKQLDVDLAACVGDISLTLNVAQIRMQQRTFEEVEKLTAAIQTQRASEDGTLSEEALQQIVAASGCTQEEADAELVSIAADVQKIIDSQEVRLRRPGLERVQQLIYYNPQVTHDGRSAAHARAGGDPGDSERDQVSRERVCRDGRLL